MLIETIALINFSVAAYCSPQRRTDCDVLGSGSGAVIYYDADGCKIDPRGCTPRNPTQAEGDPDIPGDGGEPLPCDGTPRLYR